MPCRSLSRQTPGGSAGAMDTSATPHVCTGGLIERNTTKSAITYSGFLFRCYSLDYIHSPRMHGSGPFNAMGRCYLLFGADNFTARMHSAVSGLILVLPPWLLRRQIGHWPAWIASFLFLVPSSFVCSTRFARKAAVYAAMEKIFMVRLWQEKLTAPNLATGCLAPLTGLTAAGFYRCLDLIRRSYGRIVIDVRPLGR